MVRGEMDTSNLWGIVIRLGIGVLGLAMVLFMLQRPELYPLWTVVLIGLVALGGFVSLVRLVRE
jgi:predicted membrane channel-forming protein YqfA (hemolysin III family)